MGGVIGLAGAIVIGPRIGKYVSGKPQAMPGHNLRWSSLGTFILAFGWFGFNPGSTLAGTDLRISFVVVNTHARQRHRADRRDAHLGLEGDEARSLDALQRHARRPRGDHRSVRVRQPDGSGDHRLHRRRPRRLQRVLLRQSSASTTRSARSPCTASTASGASSPSASSQRASTARGGTAWSATPMVEGLRLGRRARPALRRLRRSSSCR